jgi:hypothetical protein
MSRRVTRTNIIDTYQLINKHQDLTDLFVLNSELDNARSLLTGTAEGSERASSELALERTVLNSCRCGAQ